MRIRLACLISISALLVQSSVVLGQIEGYRVTVIAAESGELAYSFYDWPALNEQGAVCYYGGPVQDDEASLESAILLGDIGLRKRIAVTADLPGRLQRFVTRVCSINDAGEVVFDACRDCDPREYDAGIYLSLNGDTPTLLQGSGQSSTDFLMLAFPTITNARAISFLGSLQNGGKGIWMAQGGALRALIYSDSKEEGFLWPFINEQSQLTFLGTLAGNTGVYDASGAALTGAFNGFTEVSLPVINSAAQVAYMAHNPETGEYGVYRDRRQLARNGQLFERLPTDQVMFYGISMNDKGDIVFPAESGDASAMVYMAYLAKASGEVQLLLKSNDVLPALDAPIEGVRVGRESINNQGQIALAVSLDNGKSAVLRLDPESMFITPPVDNCPDNPYKLEPGVCGCASEDLDRDADGRYDCQDGCAEDPAKIAPDVCGCGVTDADQNANGLPDCLAGRELLQRASGLQGQFRRLRALQSLSGKAKTKQLKLRKAIKKALKFCRALADEADPVVVPLHTDRSLSTQVREIDKAGRGALKASARGVLNKKKKTVLKLLDLLRQSMQA